MAAFNATNYGYRSSIPSVKIPAGENSGSVLVAYDSYTTLANLALNDTINLGGKIPPGAKVLWVNAIVPTNGGTLSIGITGSLTKYASGLTPSVSSVVSLVDNSGTSEDELVVNCSVAATATGAYKFAIYYVMV